VKLLYLNPVGGLGGAEKVLLAVMHGVRQTHPEHQLHLLTMADGPFVDRVRQLGAGVTILPLPAPLQALGDSQLAGARGRAALAFDMARQALQSSSAGLSYLRQLRRHIVHIHPDLIHSNGIKTHCLAWLAGPANIPVVWHVHDFISTRPLASRILQLASRRVASALAISQAVADDCQKAGLTCPIRVIPNTVDVHAYAPAPGDGVLLDRLAGIDPDPACCRVGLIATYARWKGHEVFLQAAARLLASSPSSPVRFYVIGGPIYATRGSQYDIAELREIAQHLGIERHVAFIPFQQNVVPIYRALDIVVHASTAPEPFGLTIIEAMACGKPVIATFAGGVVDIIHPDHDALGIPRNDPQALARALQSLLDNPALRTTLAANARNTVCERFNQDRLGSEVIEAYRAATNRPAQMENPEKMEK
jgi:glycosyltransferase involved in cell wall biosynthesis